MQHTTTTLTLSELLLPAGQTFMSLFASVESNPWSLLFDTSQSKQSDGRFNMIMVNPAKVVVAQQGTICIIDTTDNSQETSHDKPLAAVSALVENLKQTVKINNKTDVDLESLPFIVGAAGLCGYDLGRYYETLPNMAEGGYACPDMAMGIYLHCVIEDTLTGRIFETKRPECQSILDYDVGVHKNKRPFALTGEWQSNMTQSQYTQNLTRVHDYLVAGDCYQINFAQRFNASYEGSEWQAYLSLREANKAPFSSFMRLPESCILSISPERFISTKQGDVETKPIKGTRPRSDNKEEDNRLANALLTAEKDRAENLMIVDLLRNDISKHCEPGSVTVPNLFSLESYNAVHHMVSTVKGRLKPSSSCFDLLSGAFPGGSITGAPKIRAMEIIDELEPHQRNIYCGSIVYLGIFGDMDSSICIRTLLAENNTLYCWAGGGIVLDSNAKDEYQETLDKVSRILPILASEK